MPRLDRLGLDERTLSVLASLPVPITLAESLLCRDSEQLALECRVSLAAVSKLRYLVALRCQAQPIVPDSRVQDGADADDCNAAGQELSGNGGGGVGSGTGGVGGRADAVGSAPALPSFCTADVLYRQVKEVGGYVTTGSDSLDSLLCKGLMLHHVVEVVGRSAVGKSQLCLTAAVAAASHGIGVLYIDTANGSNVKRLQQIARSRYADAHGEMTVRQMDALLDRLRIVRAFDVSTVISALVAYMDGVTSDSTTGGVYSSCRLVILDSVTAVISPLLGGVKNPAGHGLMATLGHLLNRAASQCSACVLVANSTVGARNDEKSQDPRAALGLTWEGVPSIRLMLTEQPGSSWDDAGVTRTATVLKHPAQACGSSTVFSIGDGGITDVQEYGS